MKQNNKNQVYVTLRSKGKATEIPLKNLPEIQKRVAEVERAYGVRVTSCKYEPSKGNLLTMRYAERSQGADAPSAQSAA